MLKFSINSLRLVAILAVLAPLSASAEPAPPDATLTGHQSPAIAVAFSADGTRLGSVADDGLLKIWDLAAKKELFSFPGMKQNQNQVRFTPDGKTAIALGSDQNIVVIDVSSGKARKPIAIANLMGGPAALDLSPDGKTVAVVGRGSLRLFDLASGVAKGAFDVHKEHLASGVAYSTDGTRIATVGSDHIALVLDAATGKVLHTFDLKYDGDAVVFSHDGKTLITSSTDRVISSFDIESGEAKKLLDKGIQFRTIAVSHDGKALVLGGAGRGPWLLSLPDEKLTDNAYTGDDRINCAAISKDGKWLAGGGNEGAIYLWKAGT